MLAGVEPGDGSVQPDAEKLERQFRMLRTWQPELIQVRQISENATEITLIGEEAFTLPPPPVLPDMYPDAAPGFQPAPARVPDPAPLPAVNPLSGVRPTPRNRPELELTIKILPGRITLDEPTPTVRLQVRLKPKHQLYAVTRRKIDAKGVYLQLMGLVTATFGTLTEVQDFVEALAWNATDRFGRPAMLVERPAAFKGEQMKPGDWKGGLMVSMRQYVGVFNGLASGKYSLDLGGFAFDYAMMQAGDIEAALPGKARQMMSNFLGSSQVAGIEATINQFRRMSGEERENYLDGLSISRIIARRYRSAFTGRATWHRTNGIRTSP